MTESVRFDDVSLLYPGGTVPAVSHLNLTIEKGEFLVLVGPSGCGKSTSLRMVAGLEPISEGKIYIGDRDVTHLAAKDRDIAMVFQNYALYPHMSVGENMAFALKIQKVSKEEIARRVQEAAKLLDLTEYVDRKPKALSGGQRQRVAIARALVTEPAILLGDEPTGNLDSATGARIIDLLFQLNAEQNATLILVTHEHRLASRCQTRIELSAGEMMPSQGKQ